MIVAGIDEAGYGPLLGPLVVGCSAFKIENPPAIEPMPCFWKTLRRVVSKRKPASGRKLHFNDSKIVYSPSLGLKELERSILALAAATHGPCNSLDSLLKHVADHALADIESYPWYQSNKGEAFPITHSSVSIGMHANSLALEMGRQNVACVYLAARVVCERQLNTMLAATRNKASALFSITAIHLQNLLTRFGQSDLTIVCDRQGGREHYAWLLRLMFPDWALEIVREKEGDSEYQLKCQNHRVRLLFWEKSESRCLPVAVAAMLSKYLREALMGRFNAYWLQHVPTAQPTAGYYVDGLRFLRDIEPKRKQLGVSDEQLIRSR